MHTSKNTPYPFERSKGFPEMPVSLNNEVTIEGAILGKHLFYDPILSLDRSLSCGSCHKQENAFADGSIVFSFGINKKPQKRNTPPLFNLAWYDAMFWDGRSVSIESQVFEPVKGHDEMGLDWKLAESRIQDSKYYSKEFKKVFGDIIIDSVLIAKAISQFERTLISNQSKFDKVLIGELEFTKEEYLGFVFVNDQSMGNCLHCHSTDANALGTNGGFANNGLDQKSEMDKGFFLSTGMEEDIGKFKIPSLRNLLFTAPYMHDGRFATLEEVIDFYSSGIQNHVNRDSRMRPIDNNGERFSPIEKRQILAFLQTLTDSSMVNNPEYSNPFMVGN